MTQTTPLSEAPTPPGGVLSTPIGPVEFSCWEPGRVTFSFPNDAGIVVNRIAIRGYRTYYKRGDDWRPSEGYVRRLDGGEPTTGVYSKLNNVLSETWKKHVAGNPGLDRDVRVYAAEEVLWIAQQDRDHLERKLEEANQKVKDAAEALSQVKGASDERAA